MAALTAAQLKEQGNALFVEKDFARAHEKYTEAIAIGGKNAVLYANRSACSFGMGRYFDALRDADQATEIDPGYAKGWSRFATACEATEHLSAAVDAWQKALSALPKAEASLTPAERSQKAQYTAALKESKRRLAAGTAQSAPWVVTNLRTEKPPWQLAEEMLPELQAGGQAMLASSGYLIYFANQEWSKGMERMKTLKKVSAPGTPGGFGVYGHTETLACISNAIMRDSRVFRIDRDCCFEKINDQLQFEASQSRAWPEEGVDVIQQQALQRLREEGWNSVRPALSVTIRSWIILSFCDSEYKQAPHVAAERLRETLQLLHWGRQVWRDVHKDDRGVIFEETFVRGVRSMYLEKLRTTHMNANDTDKAALLDTLLQEAREMIKETEKVPPPPGEPVDAGFFSSFCIYPAAEAHATVGYCFIQMAHSAKHSMEQTQYALLAAGEYSKAASMLPEDDEKHCYYLQLTIQPMVSAGLPKEKIKDVARAIRVAMPKMQRIWRHSVLAKQGRDKMIETALRLAEN